MEGGDILVSFLAAIDPNIGQWGIDYSDVKHLGGRKLVINRYLVVCTFREFAYPDTMRVCIAIVMILRRSRPVNFAHVTIRDNIILER